MSVSSVPESIAILIIFSDLVALSLVDSEGKEVNMAFQNIRPQRW